MQIYPSPREIFSGIATVYKPTIQRSLLVWQLSLSTEVKISICVSVKMSKLLIFAVLVIFALMMATVSVEACIGTGNRVSNFQRIITNLSDLKTVKFFSRSYAIT